ncbi:MAG: BACON domain-containing protein, partial [bacterium]|nr:BACON domain-containing protein [Candidatus Colisoma equi]
MRTCALLLLLFATCVASAAVSITTSAKTFQKDGGAASVTITGTGSWTATADADWIVIKQGASGTDAGSCVYIVNANTTADTRIGHIKIGGNTYTITQYGYTATISPSSATLSRDGGGGTITVTVDAGVSWSAVANDSWIAVSPASGTSVGAVSYTVAEYPGVISRVGSITIGGKVFSVTQTGVDVNLEPKRIAKSSDADIVSVTVTALAQTGWTVVPNDPWISVIDKSSGYGDYVLTLAINSNPSFARRTGTVSVGSAILTIVQEGLSAASLTINPETATASPSGAYGNVAVYATPDAPWTATSLTSWLTISEGATGAGNGNIKYVASANPTVESRVGQILIQPPHKVVEPDLHRGLLFWIKDQKIIEGNELRQASVPL